MNGDNSVDIEDAVLMVEQICGSQREVVIKPEPQPQPEPEPEPEPAKPVSPVPAADGHFDLSSLSRVKKGWGHGGPVDSLNRSQGAVWFTNTYGKYYSRAINLDSDKIMLTFDEGYENGYTPQILDTLKEKNVKATFFICKNYAVKNPELVQRMLDEGHTVGNHTVNHLSLPTLSQAKVTSEIMDLHNYVKENFDYEMTMFRPPSGEYSEFTLALAANLGYNTYMWSWAHYDWNVSAQPNVSTSLKNAVNAAAPGGIYLLHAESKTNTTMLGDFIDGVRAKGFEFEGS